MVTHWIFAGFVILLAVQRLAELRLSQRNERFILSRGGQEHAAGHFQAMKLLHFAWFLAMLGEVFILNRPFIPGLALGALILFGAGQGLRYAAIRTLGWRWTVRVMTLPGVPPVDGGIYRVIRHPNYLGVILEIIAAPLLHTAYWTAAFFTVANVALLYVRIRAEERALQEQNHYSLIFQDRPRFLPDFYSRPKTD